jgi:hypothetical protein
LAVIDAGLVLQVDDAVLANMYDELVQKSPQLYREWAELRVEALNHALRGIPEDRVRYHVCFGSWHVPHVADAPLESIVDLIMRVRAVPNCTSRLVLQCGTGQGRGKSPPKRYVRTTLCIAPMMDRTRRARSRSPVS